MQRLLPRTDDAPALIDGDTGDVISHRRLHALVADRADALAGLRGRVVLLGVHRAVDSVVDYLALTRLGATVALLDPQAPTSRLAGWVAAYRPDAVFGIAAAPETEVTDWDPLPPIADRVLLPTSGTTGNPKFVRLSADNVMGNARQIVAALRITPARRALLSLPLHYSYGLSVLNSHLLAGASVVLTRASLVRPEFLRTLRDREVTSLAGVPFSFSVFERLHLFDQDLPDLRHVTVAGGRLGTDATLRAADALAAHGAGLWTMYGQTEATARICVLPPEELPAQAGSVGWPVPGSRVTIQDPDPTGVGEIVVDGPQVMLGYARDRDDLGTGDVLRGRLRTGDLGRVDDRGRLWVTGRTSRIAKVAGVRVSLDDVESLLTPLGVAAALDGGDHVVAVVEAGRPPPGLHRRLERAADLPPGAVEVVALPLVPRTSAGKVDHAALAHQVAPRG